MNVNETILFQNDSFLIANKPAEMLSTPDRIQDKAPDKARAVLGLLLQEELGQQIYPVHRLDYEVSGLVMYAKTAKAHRILNRYFELHYVKKTYEAFALPSIDSLFNAKDKLKSTLDWKCTILRGKKRAYECKHGKLAHTKATLMEIHPQTGVEKWILSPLTGRGHQLRFEMFRHDRPILGDVLYGADPRSEAGIALKAIGLDFSLAKKALPEEFLSLGLSSTYKFDGQKFEIE